MSNQKQKQHTDPKLADALAGVERCIEQLYYLQPLQRAKLREAAAKFVRKETDILSFRGLGLQSDDAAHIERQAKAGRYIYENHGKCFAGQAYNITGPTYSPSSKPYRQPLKLPFR